MVNKILRVRNELGITVTILNCMDVRRSFISIKEIYYLWLDPSEKSTGLYSVYP